MASSLLVLTLLGTIMFICDWKSDRALEEVERYRRRAEDSARHQRRFLANRSHEIRTPLTAMLGFAEEILHCGDLSRIPKDRLDAIEAIRRNGQHLASIVDDILDLSKIEVGALELERVTFSPVMLSEEVVSAFGVQARSKGLRLDLRLEGAVPDAVTGDPTRVRQVLFNLVGNALKFTQRGGVEIRLELLRGPDRPQLRFSVSDTGIGMSPDQMERVFEPFTQADASTNRQYGGTGLGLTICRRLVDLMRGDLEASSVPGQGSTFSFRIPALPPSDSGGVPRDAHVGAVLGQEDAAVEMDRLAGRALEALRAGEPYDLVLMDLQMPVLDGYEATRGLRRAGYPGKVVALTAHALSQDRDEALRVGCDAHLTKPIRRLNLLSRVSQLLADAK
jgi:signal transduction histidine kinase/CheY-like chemotaxis protein